MPKVWQYKSANNQQNLINGEKAKLTKKFINKASILNGNSQKLMNWGSKKHYWNLVVKEIINNCQSMTG